MKKLRTFVDAAVTTTIIANNDPDRSPWKLTNMSMAAAFVKFGPGASLTDYTILLAPYTSYMGATIYTGIITAIWTADHGRMKLTQYITPVSEAVGSVTCYENTNPKHQPNRPINNPRNSGADLHLGSVAPTTPRNR